MPAKDFYHDTVRNALVKDGWTITHDPLFLEWGRRDLYVDLGAEQLLAAEKGKRKIAVEVKSFRAPSDMESLEQARGQFVLYHDILSEREPDRVLFLAIPVGTWRDVFDDPIGELLLKRGRVRLVVFEPQQEVLVRWIPEFDTAKSSNES